MKRALVLVLIAAVVLLGIFVGTRLARPGRETKVQPGTTGRRGSLYDRNSRLLAFADSTTTPPKRRYPLGDTLSRLLGFTGEAGDGRAGLEYSLDSVLKPKARILGGSTSGSDVYLTIDLDLQRIAFSQLKNHVDACRAQQGSAIIMDAGSGAILALVEYPGYDPYRHRLFPPETWRCPSVTDALELGSTTDSQVEPQRMRNSTPRHQTKHKDTKTQRNSLGALVPLCLTPLGAFVFDSDKLGFGQTTGIELAGEATGSIPDSTGFRSSLLQLAQALAIIAENRPAHPFLVAKVSQESKTIYERHDVVSTSVFRDDSVRKLRQQLLIGTDAGEPVTTYGIGGKVIQSGADESEHPREALVFVGVRATNGEVATEKRSPYVIAVMIDQPLTGYGSPDAAQLLFHDIAERKEPLMNATEETTDEHR